MQVLAVHRRTLLPHLGVEDHADGVDITPHRERCTKVANDRSDHVAPPGPIIGTVAGTSSQANGGGVNGFLPQRSEALPLERRAAERDLAAGEELLEPV